MRKAHAAIVVALAGLLAVPGGQASAQRARMGTLAQRCDQADRAASDLVRAIERNPQYDRGQDNVVIADLTAFRAYARALRETADEARDDAWRRVPFPRRRVANLAMKRLAQRLRSTASNIELELSFERSLLVDDWRRVMRDTLDDLVAIVYAEFEGEDLPPPPPPPGDRPPAGAVRIQQAEVYTAPAALQGRATTIRIEAFGGTVKVRRVKYTVTETAFGYFTFDLDREQRVNRDVLAGQALLVQVDRGQVAQVSKIEVEWEPEGRRVCYGRVTLTQE